MKTVEIKTENAITAYNNADSAGKKLLTNLLGSKLFEKLKITDRVKTLEDAYEIVSEMSTREAIYAIAEYDLLKHLDDKSASLNFAIIRIFALALNEGWIADLNDTNQKKWKLYFTMKAGIGFSFYDASCGYSATPVGSRLEYKTEELAIYAAQICLQYYKNLFVQ